MPYQLDDERKQLRDAFIRENTLLLERCSITGTTDPQSDLDELITKARVHFNYAPSTRGLDIKRAVLTAFRRHLEKQPVDR